MPATIRRWRNTTWIALLVEVIERYRGEVVARHLRPWSLSPRQRPGTSAQGVYLDGDYIGDEPVETELPVGTYVIVLRMDGKDKERSGLTVRQHHVVPCPGLGPGIGYEGATLDSRGRCGRHGTGLRRLKANSSPCSRFRSGGVSPHNSCAPRRGVRGRIHATVPTPGW